MCNVACAVLAALVLLGMLLTALFGLWWADAVAAVIFAIYIGREGLNWFENSLRQVMRYFLGGVCYD